MEEFRSSPRQADLLIVSGRVAHKMAAPLRQVYDQMLEPKWVIAMGACASSGGMFNNYTILQGVDKIVPVDIHVPGCPPRPEALMEGIIRLHEKVMAGVPPAYEIRGSGLLVAYDGVPGLVETQGGARRDDARRRPGARWSRRASHLRDELGFNLLADITATDYLGWGERGVSGYIGTPAGRDLNDPGAQGYARHARRRSRSASRSTTTCSRARRRRRARARPGVARRRRDASRRVVPVWPTADWHEREAWDMMGIPFDGHPEPRPDPDGRRLGGAPAAQGLPDRRRARALLGGGVVADRRARAHADLRGLADPAAGPDGACRSPPELRDRTTPHRQLRAEPPVHARRAPARRRPPRRARRRARAP